MSSEFDFMEEDEFLQHYGVKGMKWGVRRRQDQLDRAAGRPASKKQERQVVRATRKLNTAKRKLRKAEKDRQGRKEITVKRLNQTRKQNKQIHKDNRKARRKGEYNKIKAPIGYFTGEKLSLGQQLASHYLKQIGTTVAIVGGTKLAVSGINALGNAARSEAAYKQATKGVVRINELNKEVFTADFMETVVPANWKNPVSSFKKGTFK